MVDVTADRKNLRSAMDKAFQELKLKGLEGHGEERWYVQLPSVTAHEFHEFGKSPVRNQKTPIKFDDKISGTRMHPKIAEKIRELVQKGESRVYAIRKQLRKFVERFMFEGDQIPERHNLSFFPTVHNIQNHIYQAIKDLESGKLEKLANTSNSDSEADGENSMDTSDKTSTANYQPQPEMITVTLMQPPQNDSSLFSKVETQLSDGSVQITTTLTPETAQFLSRLNANMFGATLLSEPPAIENPIIPLSEKATEKKDEQEQATSLLLEEEEHRKNPATITLTMGAGGEILHIENNSAPQLPLDVANE